jgi:hypothetical protein
LQFFWIFSATKWCMGPSWESALFYLISQCIILCDDTFCYFFIIVWATMVELSCVFCILYGSVLFSCRCCLCVALSVRTSCWSVHNKIILEDSGKFWKPFFLILRKIEQDSSSIISSGFCKHKCNVTSDSTIISTTEILRETGQELAQTQMHYINMDKHNYYYFNLEQAIFQMPSFRFYTPLWLHIRLLQFQVDPVLRRGSRQWTVCTGALQVESHWTYTNSTPRARHKKKCQLNGECSVLYYLQTYYKAFQGRFKGFWREILTLRDGIP